MIGHLGGTGGRGGLIWGQRGADGADVWSWWDEFESQPDETTPSGDSSSPITPGDSGSTSNTPYVDPFAGWTKPGSMVIPTCCGVTGVVVSPGYYPPRGARARPERNPDHPGRAPDWLTTRRITHPERSRPGIGQRFSVIAERISRWNRTFPRSLSREDSRPVPAGGVIEPTGVRAASDPAAIRTGANGCGSS